jgi:hypothetical protein
MRNAARHTCGQHDCVHMGALATGRLGIEARPDALARLARLHFTDIVMTLEQ